MSNQLRAVRAEVHRLSVVEAEIWIVIEVHAITPTTQVRGRVTGPRRPGATTVEVAYPLRVFDRLPPGLPLLARCVVIPDPSLWEPEKPFLYRVLIELWQDGERCDQAELEVGLRMRG